MQRTHAGLALRAIGEYPDAAIAAGVPVMQNIPLAHALFDEASVDQYIPSDLIEPVAAGFMDKAENPVGDRVRATFKGAMIQNGGFDGASANACIAAGTADAVSFGRPFIGNPDFVNRMRNDLPLASANMDFAYVGDARGYVDYSAFQPAEAG